MKLSLQDGGIKTYSAHNEGKSVVAERFIRAFKNKIYKYITSVSKNGYVDNNLDDTVNKHTNIYDKTIKMKMLICKGLHSELFRCSFSE